jgi:hypothetical protein
MIGQNNGVTYTFSGLGTADNKLTTGGNTIGFGGGRFDAAVYQNASWTCGSSGILYFEWGPGSYDDDGPFFGTLNSYLRNGNLSTVFATAVLDGTAPIINDGQKRRGISVNAGDIIKLQQFVVEKPGTPLRAWIESSTPTATPTLTNTPTASATPTPSANPAPPSNLSLSFGVCDGQWSASWTASPTAGVSYLLTRNGTTAYSGAGTSASGSGGNDAVTWRLVAVLAGAQSTAVTVSTNVGNGITCCGDC